MITMTQVELDGLLEYSCSLPTGQTIGKRWKRREPYSAPSKEANWFVGEYVEHPDPNTIGIKWTRIILVDDRFGFPL